MNFLSRVHFDYTAQSPVPGTTTLTASNRSANCHPRERAKVVLSFWLYGFTHPKWVAEKALFALFRNVKWADYLQSNWPDLLVLVERIRSPEKCHRKPVRRRWLCTRWCCSVLWIISTGWARSGTKNGSSECCSDVGGPRAFWTCPTALPVSIGMKIWPDSWISFLVSILASVWESCAQVAWWVRF